ncbi:MAG: hypothetical protein A2Y62_11410 [Candidatus Fischerbacteria bacterium RBG_13_37_8]|uniref:4Fe4S-binding SPASM domain-containing protein n=1 Tax=Candidatus Fischerbacteria bacterium RBG_13_37_8 TaxID=1817863 RepID=A0A1F5VY88_9BACT|nr:MAG: hypothetical protein A2Y62_11410 [Candidatus Fischerbacteria bacterium RBG_13_37_8]
MPDTSSEHFLKLLDEIKQKAFALGIIPMFVIHRSTEHSDSSQPKPLLKYFCTLPWDHLLVHTDGKCYFCCYIDAVEGLIGNLTTQSFEGVWNSSKANEIRGAIAQGKMPLSCEKCTVFGLIR